MLSSVAVAPAAVSLTFGSSASAQTAIPGMTRAEVRQQLVQAQADGLLPVPENNYPLPATRIGRNKELYAIGYQNDPVSATAFASTSPTDWGVTCD
ncbi:DUF4148 domain-containing protein [Paraburkholderia sp. UCT70]|uniref:DUF4148 domain-containing protein n=1 Tax=Paraburkholderia sp. UCT70 TaxID=2991068 RepID=UPI003D244BA8